MKILKYPAIAALLIFTASNSKAQGLLGIVVETYYVADAHDAAADPDKTLKAGAVTYRIYAHLKEDYKLLTVYGAPENPMFFKTSTHFYNNSERSKQTGTEFSILHLHLQTAALDSYLAFGGSSRRHLAIPKGLDTDGSIYAASPVDSTSSTEKRLLLRNNHELAGIPLFQNDGLIVEEKGIAHLRTFGDLDLNVFGTSTDASEFITSNGAWAVGGGLKTPATDNHILIAQLTTDGELSFELNLQIQSDTGITEYYVARNPEKKEKFHPQLIYPHINPLNE